MKAILVLGALALGVVVLLFSSGASASADTFTIVQLTANSAQDAVPEVSGDRVV